MLYKCKLLVSYYHTICIEQAVTQNMHTLHFLPPVIIIHYNYLVCFVIFSRRGEGGYMYVGGCWGGGGVGGIGRNLNPVYYDYLFQYHSKWVHHHDSFTCLTQSQSLQTEDTHSKDLWPQSEVMAGWARLARLCCVRSPGTGTSCPRSGHPP